MKKTFTINLGGKVLNIDDDALESLQQYINALKAHYSKGEDGEEIMYSIESRLAELFIENLKPGIRLDPRRGTSHFHHGKTGRHF